MTNSVTFMSGIQMALANIREAKLRAFLTVLGVVIGTGTIIGVGPITLTFVSLSGVASTRPMSGPVGPPDAGRP